MNIKDTDRILLGKDLQKSLFKNLRAKLNLSFREFSNSLQVSPSTLRHMAKGERTIRGDVFKRMLSLAPSIQKVLPQNIIVKDQNWGQRKGGLHRANQLIVPLRQPSLKVLTDLIACLFSEGGVTCQQNSYVTHFANCSQKFITVFQDSVRHFSQRLRIYCRTRPLISGSICTYCFVKSKSLGSFLLSFSKSYRSRSCASYPVCPKLRGKDHFSCKQCEPSYYKDVQYPPIRVPSFIEKSSDLSARFLRVVCSAEGYLYFTLRERRNVEFILRITCKNPVLGESYKEMLKKFNIFSTYDGRYIQIARQESLINFARDINFLDGVEITKHSKWLYGFDKKKLMDAALNYLRARKSTSYRRRPGGSARESGGLTAARS